MRKTFTPRLLLLGLLVWLSTSLTAWAQTGGGTISGRVLDTKGEPVIGATILVPGTTKGAATDMDGNFTIRDVPAGTYKVAVSSVGMNTFSQEVTVADGGTASLNAAMSENATLLAEAVVVGYGTVRRQEVTGSVATVSTKDFVQGQVTNPANLIVGKIAGVVVTPPTGAPGAGSPIRIRGGSSLSASNDPLIVIDGVPVDNRGLEGAPDVLSTINPNDIETFTILKDASATAIYGSRASNGVILITTKKGLQGEKLRLNFNTQFSVARNYRKVDVLSADEFRALLRDSVASPGVPSYQVFGPAQQKILRQFPGQSTDWQEEIFGTAYTSDNNLSLTGSIAETVPFRASVGYLNQQGTLTGGNVRRNSASIGVTPSLFNNSLRIDANLKGSWNDNLEANADAIGAAINFDPTKPVRSDRAEYAPVGGYFEWFDGPANNRIPNGNATRNPVSLLEQNRNRSTTKRAIGNIQFDYRLPFLPDLKAVLNLGYDLARGSRSITRPVTAATDFNTLGLLTNAEEKKDNKLLDAYLNYAKAFESIGGRLDLTGGYSYQDFRYRRPSVPTNRKLNGEFINPLFPASIGSDEGYTLLSWFGRANFNIKDRYLITATLRNDRTSRFGPENRSGYFPAVGLAWRVKGENFLANNTAVSDLKLRVGYGQTGQQEVGGFYPYLARYRFAEPTAYYQLGVDSAGNPIYVQTARPNGYNSNLQWETTTTYNIGLDYGFFDNRVYGAVDVYQRNTTDLLSNVDFPVGSNLTDVLDANIGELQNRGIEASINVVPVRTNDLIWTLNLNATHNQQEITKLINGEKAGFRGFLTGDISGGIRNRAQINAVGHPAGVFFLYQQEYDENGKPRVDAQGNPVFVDTDTVGQGGRRVINENDRVPGKQWQPKVLLGFSSNLQYKQVGLAFTLRSQFGGYNYRNVASNSGFYQRVSQNASLNNINSEVSKSGFGTEASLLSDYFLQKSDFVRLDNITLSYDFGSLFGNNRTEAGTAPSSGRNGINVRASLAVQNAFIITKYDGLDPEVFGGIDRNFYPRPRIFTLGINASF